MASKPLIISKRPWTYVVGAISLCIFGLMALFIGIEGKLGYRLWWILAGITLFIFGAILLPYTLRIRKVKLDDERFQYFIGKKKKMDALWSEITSVGYNYTITEIRGAPQDPSYYLIVMSNEQDVSIGEDDLGKKEELERIYNYIKEKEKEYENITIEIGTDWYIEKKYHVKEGRARIKNALFPKSGRR